MNESRAMIISANPQALAVVASSARMSTQQGTALEVYARGGDREKNLKLIDRAIAIAHSHHVPIGISTGATDAQTIRFWNDRGMDILSCGMEFDYILRGAKQTRQFISEAQGR